MARNLHMLLDVGAGYYAKCCMTGDTGVCVDLGVQFVRPDTVCG